MPRKRQQIEGFAEDLGRLLGSARAKADSWLGQRQTIVKNLEQVRDTANHLLQQLGHQAAVAGQRGRRAVAAAVEQVRRGPGRPKGSGKKKRTMSAEARAKISAAQKARWAKQKKATKS